MVVVKTSLELENQINIVLNEIFVVKDPSKTRTFKKNGNLKVQNKIDLFYDFNLITKSDYTMLCTQLEIRNAFVHNIEIENFEDYLNYVTENSSKSRFLSCSDKENYLEKYLDLCGKNLQTVLSVLKSETESIKRLSDKILGNAKCLDFASTCISDNLNEIVEITKKEPTYEELQICIKNILKHTQEALKNINENRVEIGSEDFLKMVLGSF